MLTLFPQSYLLEADNHWGPQFHPNKHSTSNFQVALTILLFIAFKMVLSPMYTLCGTMEYKLNHYCSNVKCCAATWIYDPIICGTQSNNKHLFLIFTNLICFYFSSHFFFKFFLQSDLVFYRRNKTSHFLCEFCLLILHFPDFHIPFFGKAHEVIELQWIEYQHPWWTWILNLSLSYKKMGKGLWQVPCSVSSFSMFTSMECNWSTSVSIVLMCMSSSPSCILMVKNLLFIKKKF